MQGHRREVYIYNRPIDFESVLLTLISPIFSRVSDDLFTENFLSQDFTPARNLANMLSNLYENEAPQKESFWSWLLETLPDIEREEESHDAPLQPHKEVRARLTTAIIKGKRRDKKHYFEIDGHVELGDNLLLVVEANPELGEEPSNLHWQMMAYVRAYHMQTRCYNCVGQSPCQQLSFRSMVCLSLWRACPSADDILGSCIDGSAAIVCPDGSVQVEALTPALRVDCDYRDDCQHKMLAGFIRALRNTSEGPKTFYESPSRPIPDPCGYRSNKHASIDRPFPYKDSYTNNRGIQLAFKYKSRLMRNALLFLAEHTGPEANAKPIVVNFTRTYSEVVHKLLASNGFAPELFAVED